MTDVTVDTASDLPITVEAPFTAQGDDVLYNGRTIMRKVGSIMLLVQSIRNQLNLNDSEVFDRMLFTAASADVTIKRVHQLSDFFNGSQQFIDIAKMPLTNAYQFATQIGMDITLDDLLALLRYDEAKKKIISFFNDYGKKKLAPGAYPFADVPPNGTKLRIRKHGAHTLISNGQYSLGKRIVNDIWEVAKKVWRGDENAPTTYRFKRSTGSGYYRSSETRVARIHSTTVEIGCQTIPRWQLEQVALDLGLSFE